MSRHGAKYICKDLRKVQVLQKNVSTCTCTSKNVHVHVHVQVQVQLLLAENLKYGTWYLGAVHN